MPEPLKPLGYNEMRWDCHEDGRGENCFNLKRRPKLGVFAECFPGKIGMGDVDGETEIGGFFLQLEWKGEGGSLSTGQIIKFCQLTRANGNVVFVVEGNAETMEAKRYCCFWRGQQSAWIDGTIHALKAEMNRWADWADVARNLWPGRFRKGAT